MRSGTLGACTRRFAIAALGLLFCTIGTATTPSVVREDYRVTTAENFERGLPLGMIYATSRAMLRDRVRSLREANVYEAQRYRHVIGAALVTPGEDGTLKAQTSFIVARIMHGGETTLFHTPNLRLLRSLVSCLTQSVVQAQSM